MQNYPESLRADIKSPTGAQPFPRSRSKGCGLGCLGALVGLPLMFVLIGYLLLFHTSMPLKWLAKQFEDKSTSGGNPVEISGVSGSISSGFEVGKIVVHGETGNSTIDGLKFRYSGLWDSIRNRKLVIEELSVKRSDFVVGSDFFEPSTDGEATAESGADGNKRPGSSASDGEGLKLFELRELKISETRIRTADGQFDVRIPLIHLAGLKIEGDDFELSELEVNSDYLELELADAKPEQIEGQLLPFKRKIEGKVLPGIHPLVKSEIDFSLDLAAVGGATRSRLTAFGGAYEQILLPDGASLVRLKGLTLGDFLDSEGYIIPERFTTTARESNNKVKFESGEFFLGETRFEIAEQQLDADDPKSAVLARAQMGDLAIKARIRPDKDRFWPPLAVGLESEPKRTPPELLAMIYFQRAYQELAPDQKSRVDALAKTMADPGTAPMIEREPPPSN